MTVNILGSEWTITICPREADAHLETMDGYTDWTTRSMVVCDVKSDTESVNDIEAYKRKVIRHEIVHAFLFESGLGENSLATDSWANNEEMVDWWAFRGGDVYKAWESVGAI